MGCFCRQTVAAMRVGMPQMALSVAAQADLSLRLRVEDHTVNAIANWLAARWLPAPLWQPDLAWLDIHLPEPPMPAASLSVLSGLIQARLTCMAAFGIDPGVPAHLPRLARIITTLNLRIPELELLAADETPWQQLATLNDQVDVVLQALDHGLLHPPSLTVQGPDVSGPPIAPWRGLLVKVKALAPLIAILRALNIDPTHTGAAMLLSEQVRALRALTLPELGQPLIVFRLISRFHAIARLRLSLGADPRTVAFSRVRLAVQRKVDGLAVRLPPSIRLLDGHLSGMPSRQPNPSLLLTPAIMAQLQSLPLGLLNRLRWQVPEFHQLTLLTTVAPVVALVEQLRALGLDPVLAAPCGTGCDAGAVPNARSAKAMPGSGTGATPGA